jgi:hypothetical protein
MSATEKEAFGICVFILILLRSNHRPLNLINLRTKRSYESAGNALGSLSARKR